MQTTPSSISAWRRTLQTNGFYLLILVFLVAFPFLVGLLTGSDPLARRGQAVFWQGVLIELFIFAILAMSYNLIFGFTGVISFGHALFFGIASYVMGSFQRADPNGLGLPLGIIAAVVVCAILGLLIGAVSLRLKGVYFAMFTLAVAQMFFIFFQRFPETGSEDGFTLGAIPDWFDPTRSRLNYYYVTLFVTLLTFLFIRRLIASPTGAVLLGIRENENRAKTIGFNTLTYKLLAITLAGVLAGVAGMLFTILNKKVGPEMLSVNFTVDPLLMTIIGGIGTHTGPVIGAVGLRLMDRTLRDATLTIGSTVIEIGKSWTLILGIIFIAVVMIFPHGVVGTWNRWRAALRQGRPSVPAEAKSA